MKTSKWFCAAVTMVCCRALSATFTVTSTADSGGGTLRQAILNANSGAGADRIEFNLPGNPPFTIAPSSPLPNITGPVTIDGKTQPGFAGAPVVVLNGASAGATDGLSIWGGNSVVQGLVINGFSGNGIFLLVAGGNTVRGNYIGTDVTGSLPQPNLLLGIAVGTSNNTIGGTNAADRNVISGNMGGGIGFYPADGTGNKVQGNYIGVNAAGTTAVAATGNGINIYNSANNVIGGATAGAGNVISGNGFNGIIIEQSGSTGNQVQGNIIGLNASGTAPVPNNWHGISILSANNIVGGTTSGMRNVISGNGFTGVNVEGAAASGNRILGNYIGLNSAGSVRAANGQAGVLVSGARNTMIGGTATGAGNVISGNALSGVEIYGQSSLNLVQGNFIGTDATGTNALANSQAGVLITDSGANTIGGTVAGARNVISGNGLTGINLNGFGTTNNLIQGNLIGTDVSGTARLPNQQTGILLFSSGVANNTIGGTSSSARNVISGNGLSGIELNGAVFNKLQGNYIGTDITGLRALGNTEDGIFLYGAFSNSVGGATSAARNIISANGLSGMEIWNGSQSNLVQGNWIGTDVTGSNTLGNAEHGVFIQNSSRNLIGGTTALGGNTIAFNGFDGVFVESGTNNAIRANSIFNNGGLGIDLGANGVTPNDRDDNDGGANNVQNFPALRSAGANAEGTVSITGVLGSRPNAVFTIEFFANVNCDPSGFGEGKRFLATTNVTTSADGTNIFSVTFTNNSAGETFITATATDSAGNTSEFCACVPILPSAPALMVRRASSSALQLNWPAGPEPAFELESTTNLSPPIGWSRVTNNVTITGAQKQVTVETSEPMQFFRLIQR